MTDADRVRALEREVARLREHLDVVDLARRNALEGEAEAWSVARRLRAERDLLRATLTFYADETAWVGPIVGDVGTGGTPIHGEPPVAADRGRRARAALGEGDGVVHLCPPDGSGRMPCCGRTPLDVPRSDRMTTDPALVTCRAALGETAG